MSDEPRGSSVRPLRRLGPLLFSGALHVLLALGLGLMFASGGTPPRVLIADLLDLSTGGRAGSRPVAPPPTPRRPLASPRPVAQETAKATIPESAVSPGELAGPTQPAAVPSQEPSSGSGVPAADTSRAGPIGDPAGVDGHANPPSAGHRVSPVYPEHMRRAALQGTSVVLAAIRADGSVGEVRLKHSAGHADLDAAAVDAVQRWRFAPAQRRGVAVDFCCVEIPIAFRLH